MSNATRVTKEEIETHPNILTVYGRRLHKMHKEGHGYKALCPFHNDHNPSFDISQKDDTWLWNCFPCNKGGDVVKFVMGKDGLTFPAAVKRIAEELHMHPKEQEPEEPEPKSEQPPFEYDPERAAARLPEISDFLTKRGISQKVARKRNVGAEEVYGLGLSVVTPYASGAAKARSIAQKQFRHIQGTTADQLYGIDKIDWITLLPDNRLFLVESELDALMLISQGYNAVSVSSATSILNKDGSLKIQHDHLEKLEEAGSILLAFDMDECGQKCADAFENVLPSDRTFRLTWPYKKGDAGAIKDIGELYQSKPATFHERLEKLVEEAKNRPPKWRSLFKSYDEMQQRELQFIAEGLIPGGITFFGGLPGSAKSWFGLSLAKALVTGKSFLKNFPTPGPTNVLYLAPENGERSFRKRMETIRITDNPRFLCRTSSQGTIQLDDPLLLQAVSELKPVVILDTAIRFIAGADENAAGQISKVLGDMLLGLVKAGALGVIAIHHAVKNSNDRSLPDLQKILRGSGDIGALADAVIGLKVTDQRTLTVTVYNAKPRDFDPPPPFVIQGRPYLDEEGDFAVIADPFQKEIDVLRKALADFPNVSDRELSRKTGINRGKIARLKKRLEPGQRKILKQTEKSTIFPTPERIM